MSGTASKRRSRYELVALRSLAADAGSTLQRIVDRSGTKKRQPPRHGKGLDRDQTVIAMRGPVSAMDDHFRGGDSWPTS